MTTETMSKVAGREESSSSSGKTFRVKESVLKKWRLEDDMIEEARAEEKRYRDEMREKITATAFEPEIFCDEGCIERISDSPLRYGVVSIALFSEDVLLYACSGTAVRHKHDNIRDHHRIFVTSARLAHKLDENRTRDDNLRIEVRTSNKKTLIGFMELYDDTLGIAVVTSFCLECVYTMDTCNPPRGTLNKQLFAFGCAPNGTLMAANCSPPGCTDEILVSVNCKITESGLGGPVLYFDHRGSGHLAGLIVASSGHSITLLPTKKLREWLQRLLLITSKTCHFRGYSLPEGVKTVIPSGFMVESKLLQSLGYPLPPPLLFDLNGRIAGRFEEHFGQFHYWEGYPFDFSYNYGPDPIWGKLGEELTQKISQSVVSVASFKDSKRCFACTGLLIKGIDGPLVLTSASLFRTGDAEIKIDEKLTIEVSLQPSDSVEGKLELYDLNYNIAILRLIHGFSTPICPQDIWNDISEPRNKMSVVAIGRATKIAHGFLMASVGVVEGKYKAVTQRGLTKKLDCKDLLLSTCKIKKVGIGGPLIGMDGRFIGMNFYDESGKTPFLPMKEIQTVLGKGLDLLRSGCSVPANVDVMWDHLTSKRRKTSRETKTTCREKKTNQWPVPEPYWYLPGQANVLDQFVGKVLM